MWALLDNDDKTVLGCIPPDKTEEEAIKIAKGRTIIKMTLENSPAHVGGIYKNGKFYKPKEIVNA